MKVLIVSFECDPSRGSEAGLGWNFAIHMSKYCEVHVLTRNEGKYNIENEIKQKNIKNIFFHYVDIPESINYYYKKGKLYLLYSQIWQYSAFGKAKILNKKFMFDIIHQITPADIRVLGKMWKINTPFVWGPIGGGQVIPDSLRGYASDYIKKEKFRELMNKIMIRKLRSVKKMANIKQIYFANEETEELFKNENIIISHELLCDVGINEENLQKNIYNKRSRKDTVKIIWIGRIVYRKGLEFLIDAIYNLQTKKNYIVELYGPDEGHEVDKLKEKINKYSLTSKIIFKGAVAHEEISDIYTNADIFVFPSLRESGGTVILEAMLHGVPVVALEQNAAKFILEECGILTKISNTNIETVKNFAEGIDTLIDDYELRVKLSKKSIECSKKYSWDKKCKKIADDYFNIINRF